MEHDERMMKLEIKLTFLEDYVKQMNEIVLEQDGRIKKLELNIDLLKKQTMEPNNELPANEKPPHY